MFSRRVSCSNFKISQTWIDSHYFEVILFPEFYVFFLLKHEFGGSNFGALHRYVLTYNLFLFCTVDA